MIDFSSKHNVLIENEDGSRIPMDEPYFESEKLMDGIWRVLTDGDYIYVVEGKQEALVIDSGYGCGDIREYCQSLTKKPIKNIANTHDHFDHTANNCYFDAALMSEKSKPLATIPFPSFDGIDFPRDYNIKIIKERDKIDLGGKELEVFSAPDHAVGSLLFLDTGSRILFSGDEIMPEFKAINTSVETVTAQFEKLYKRKNDFDWICSGPHGIFPADTIEKYLEVFEHIRNGAEGKKAGVFQKPEQRYDEKTGQVLYERHHARPCDMKLGTEDPGGEEFKRMYHENGLMVIYDIRRINNAR